MRLKVAHRVDDLENCGGEAAGFQRVAHRVDDLEITLSS